MLERIHISLVICVRGYTYHIACDNAQTRGEERPFPRPLRSLARSRETGLASQESLLAGYISLTHITVKVVQIEICAACHAQSNGLCYM